MKRRENPAKAIYDLGKLGFAALVLGPIVAPSVFGIYPVIGGSAFIILMFVLGYCVDKGGRTMLTRQFLLISIAFFSLSGCVAMQVEREIQSGRRALSVGDPKAAAPHFETVSRLDPDYLTRYSPLQIGIWTYIGRAYYEAGDREKALEGFKRAKERYSDDYLARAYLGAVMAESEQRESGAKEIEAGIGGLKSWLEALPGRSLDGKYWDPGRSMVKTMSETLAMLRAEKVDWKQVSENVRWLGRNLDEEFEKANRDRDRDLSNGEDARSN